MARKSQPWAPTFLSCLQSEPCGRASNALGLPQPGNGGSERHLSARVAHVANTSGSLTAATRSVLFPAPSSTFPDHPAFSGLSPFAVGAPSAQSAPYVNQPRRKARDLMAIPSPSCRPRGPGTGRVPVGRNGVGGSDAELSTGPGAGLDRAAWHQDLRPLAVVFLVDRLRGGRTAGLCPRPYPGGARRVPWGPH